MAKQQPIASKPSSKTPIHGSYHSHYHLGHSSFPSQLHFSASTNEDGLIKDTKVNSTNTSADENDPKFSWSRVATQITLFRQMAFPYYRESSASRWLLAGLLGLTLTKSGVSVTFSCQRCGRVLYSSPKVSWGFGSIGNSVQLSTRAAKTALARMDDESDAHIVCKQPGLLQA